MNITRNSIEILNRKNKKEFYKLRLFISGDSVLSKRTIINLNKFLNKYLKNRYKIEIIDVLYEPEYTIKEEIITMPLLIKDKPLPVIRITGDMSDEKKLRMEFLF